MIPTIPQQANRLIQDPQGNLSTYPFPPNVAGHIPPDIRKEIFDYMLKNYIWPQIQERRQFEPTWDKMRDMARATWKYDDIDIDAGTRLARKHQANILDNKDTSASLDRRMEVSDTVVFDAVDRLTNLNHFISFKNTLPVQFNIPEDAIYPYENDVYSPMSGLVKAWNCWLKYNADSQSIYRKHWMTAKHHYTYGVSFVYSEFEQKIEQVPTRQVDNTFKSENELTSIGITFEPLSIRKLWLNYRIPVYNMEFQGCPFWFEQMPRFAIVANQWDEKNNPFGFANATSLQQPQYLYGAAELEGMETSWKTVYPGDDRISLGQLLAPEFNIELLWTFFPMLPLAFNPADNSFVFDPDGTKGVVPSRFLVRTFGNNLTTGQQDIVTLQPNFYPYGQLPIYGSAHMPSLDDGAYSQAIGTVLEGHYRQICKTLEQAIDNKDWINDPPCQIQVTSPAMDKDINKKGAKIPVNGPNDISRREAVDATQSTPEMLRMLREQAQTSSKSTDAILGKAMGSRTTASEAQNVFQTAMSGVTTDINLFQFDIMGGYVDRLWSYTGRWVDPRILAAFTGNYGVVIKAQDMCLRLGRKWDTGSSFIESLTRASNIQYLLQTTPPGDLDINRAYLLRELLTEWRFRNIDKIVNDQGKEDQLMTATQQAIETYYGELVQIDPSQDHQLAIKVKISFLKDKTSIWNTDARYAGMGQRLVQQIQQHQLFLQLQALQQQALMNQQTMQGQALQSLQNQTQMAQQQQSNPSPVRIPANQGEAASQR